MVAAVLLMAVVLTILLDIVTGLSRGIGFVRFETVEQACQAIAGVLFITVGGLILTVVKK